MYRKNSNSVQEVKLQAELITSKVSDFGHRWADILNRDNADGHSQTGNRKKNWHVEFERKPKNKSNKTLFTHRRILNIYLHKLPFSLEFKDKKSWIAFQLQLVNWQLLLFKLCKMPFEQFKGFDATYHPSRVNECKFPEELFPRELSTAICKQEGILHAYACIRWTTIAWAHQI